MQPWRFIRITDTRLRTGIHGIVDEERLRTAEAFGPRADEFLALKVEGILECADLFVVALRDRRQTHVFGTRTQPQMDLADGTEPVAILCLGPVPDFPAPPAVGDRRWTRPSAERIRLGERLGRAYTGLGWHS